jgi:hypothetical protein
VLPTPKRNRGKSIATWRRELRKEIRGYHDLVLASEIERWVMYLGVEAKYKKRPQQRANDLARFRMLAHELKVRHAAHRYQVHPSRNRRS